MTNIHHPDINSEDELFYFETDHLALKGNKDYSEVLKTLLILCAQRKQAIKDYNKAVELKKEALADPSKVLEAIVKGESLGMPGMQTIPDLPKIDWSKYDVKIPEENFKFVYSETNDSKKKFESPKNKDSKFLHSTRWTPEEQKRLEELLQVYPPEPIEMRRFKKIADALGNRTLQQVTSRVQKYFLKLYKAGLPIPGRIPKSAEKHKKTVQHKHQRHNHYLLKPTTFFPDLCVPVVMNDLESVPGPSSKEIPQQPTPTSSNYLISSGYHEANILSKKSESELQLDLLKKIRKVKVKEENGNLFKHIGFRCDYCNEDPIVGTRWHCSTCTSDSIDFCTDCLLAQMYSDNCHPLRHSVVSYSDKDDFSDSESNTGSGVASLSKMGDSDSSDSDFLTEDATDEEMRDFEGVKDRVMPNGVEEGTSSDLMSENYSSLSKVDFENLNSYELSESAMDSGLFGEIDNMSYDYLHSNLLFDKD